MCQASAALRAHVLGFTVQAGLTGGLDLVHNTVSNLVEQKRKLPSTPGLFAPQPPYKTYELRLGWPDHNSTGVWNREASLNAGAPVRSKVAQASW